MRHLVYHFLRDSESVYLDKGEGVFRCTAGSEESGAFTLKMQGSERKRESHDDLNGGDLLLVLNQPGGLRLLLDFCKKLELYE